MKSARLLSGKNNKINVRAADLAFPSKIKISLTLLIPLVLCTFTFAPVQTAEAQAACTSRNGCQQPAFCMGTNTGFFAYWGVEKPFLDLTKAAAVSVDGYNPDTIAENASIPLDSNKYPTVTDRGIDVLFFSNTSASTTQNLLPVGKYVILWDGEPNGIEVRGPGVSSVVVSTNRAEFHFDSNKFGNAFMTYRNQRGKPHASNIRIVPESYEGAYRNWSWSRFKVGSSSNPPIFFPEWLEKMKRSCVIRYMNARHTNDKDAVRFNRDSAATRIKPSYISWYAGFGLGNNADKAHVWPWETIVEASRQTGATPWINFKIASYDSLVRGDSLIRDVARLFREGWSGPIYTEYGNEVWNNGYIMNVATGHVKNRGPGRNYDVNENYALRSNAVQKAFADAYDGNGCNSIGVLASQARGPHRGAEIMRYADLNYIDVLSPAVYIGKDMTPGSPAWGFIRDMYNQERSGRSRSQVFDDIRNEILTGERGIVEWNWRNDVRDFLQEYLDIAKSAGVCTAFYEGGLHMRVDRVNQYNSGDVAIAEFMRDYQRSYQQGQVEKEVNDWLRSQGGGPHTVYSAFMSAGWGTFSYWDSTFEAKNSESPRAGLIGSYRGRSNTPISVPPTVTPVTPTVPVPTSPTNPNPVSGTVQCGQPNFNRPDSQQYLWKICATGAWQFIATGGGVTSVINYSGRFDGGSTVRGLRKFRLESGDYAGANTSQVSFSLNVQGRDADAITFRTDDSSNQCIKLNNSSKPVLVGKDAIPMQGSFNPETMQPCG